MLKFFRSLKIKAQYAKIALKKIKSPKLGDIVTYKNIECMLIQGVAAPLWDLLPMTEENLAKDQREIFKYVHEADFKLKPFIKRFNFSFKSTYDFYIRNWYDIDMKKSKISL